MKCLKCDNNIPKDSKSCVHCGAKVEDGKVEKQSDEIDEDRKYRINKIPTIVAATLIVIFTLIIGYFHMNKSDKLIGHSQVVAASSTGNEEGEELEEIHIVDDIYTIAPDKIEKINFYTFPENSPRETLEWSSSNPSIKVNQSGFIMGNDENQEGIISLSNEDGTIRAETKVKITSKKDSFLEAIGYINNQEYITRDYLDFSLHSFEVGPRLQAIDRETPTDVFGMINRQLSEYKLIQKQFVNTRTDNPIDCDVYIDEKTGDIRKIVTIEYIGDYLEIKDFYYLNGKIYFIFNRNENYYRPVPAQQDFPGERYYFNQDSLLRWRNIERVEEYFEKTNYDYIDDTFTWKVYEYKDFTNTDVEKSSYKKPEEDADYHKQMKTEYLRREQVVLEEAYNLYNKVIEAPDTTNISGYVLDVNGEPMAEAIVKVFSEEFNLLVGEVKTGSDGSYRLPVPLNYSDYRVLVSKPGYVGTTIYNVDSNLAVSNLFQETIYLYEEGHDTYNVRISFRNALDGHDLSEYNSHAEIVLRKGINNRTGNIEFRDNIDLYYDEYYELGLYPGTYTAEVVTPGYESNYFTISTLYNNVEISSSLVPSINNDDIRIVLTWGANPSDLDSHLFLPNGSNIAYYSKLVDGGNLDIDETDSYGPETVTINSVGEGTYKYYVADYTNAAGGNYTSTEMSRSNARVDVYDKTGLINTFVVPRNRQGVIWHVFNIANGKIVPVQRIFNNVEDYKWWSSSKF